MGVGGGTFPQSASRDDEEGYWMYVCVCVCLRVCMNMPASPCVCLHV